MSDTEGKLTPEQQERIDEYRKASSFSSNYVRVVLIAVFALFVAGGIYGAITGENAMTGDDLTVFGRITGLLLPFLPIALFWSDIKGWVRRG